MLKKYILFFNLLSCNILFSYQEIKIASLSTKEPRAVMKFSQEVPLPLKSNPQLTRLFPDQYVPNTKLEVKSAISYQSLIERSELYAARMIEYIALENTPISKVNIYKHSKVITLYRDSPDELARFQNGPPQPTGSRQDNYLFFDFSNANPYLFKNLSFMWQEKNTTQFSPFERQIADYYQADSKSKIEFLYSYNQPNTDPWAVKIGNQIHALIWVKVDKIISEDQSPNDNGKIGFHRTWRIKDRFLVLEPDEENAEVSLLIDENNQVIAKRIKGVITFRDKQ